MTSWVGPGFRCVPAKLLHLVIYPVDDLRRSERAVLFPAGNFARRPIHAQVLAGRSDP